MKLDLEKLPDGVIVKIKGNTSMTYFDKYFIKIQDNLVNKNGFIYVDEYDGNHYICCEDDRFDIEEIYEFPIYNNVDITKLIEDVILEEKDIKPHLLYKAKEVKMFTVEQLVEQMEQILNCDIILKDNGKE